MSNDITKARVIHLREIETLVWLSARCRKKVKEASDDFEMRRYKRLLLALNRHLTQLAEALKAPLAPKKGARPNPRPS